MILIANRNVIEIWLHVKEFKKIIFVFVLLILSYEKFYIKKFAHARKIAHGDVHVMKDVRRWLQVVFSMTWAKKRSKLLVIKIFIQKNSNMDHQEKIHKFHISSSKL